MKSEIDERVIARILKLLYLNYRRYKSYFRTKTRSIEEVAFQYAVGLLLQQGRGNMSKNAENVQGASGRRFQHFISESPWDYRAVIAQIQRDVMRIFGDARNVAIHIDETSFPKQGNDSVGVKRQYCGRHGKVENCQVAACLGITNGSLRAIIDAEIFIPEDRANDPEHREKCGIPEDLEFKTKAEISLEMIRRAQSNGVKFGWIGMDTFYGRQTTLLRALNSDRKIYMADVPCDTRVWLVPPKVGLPERRSNRGRIPTVPRVLDGEPVPMEVRAIKEQLDPSQWTHTFVRDTERMELWANFAFFRVYPVEDGLPGVEQWLIIRVNDSDGVTKYQMSNAPLDTEIERFAQMSCSRYWIERAFEDGKGIAGLADFQGRSWTGWHHHISMALFAMMALLSIVAEFGPLDDLLTVQDVKEVYEKSFARRRFSRSEVASLLRKKHRARKSAKLSHHRANS
jgi:SRSO17 transposase